MKVGVITHYGLPNFGANLQALSTSLALKRMGHQPVIIDYKVREIDKLYESKTSSEQISQHDQFVESYLNTSDACYSTEDVIKVAKKENLDAVLSGSDAVLRLDNKAGDREDKRFPNPFWLTWAKEAGISYKGLIAPSCMGSNFLVQPSKVKKGIKKSIETLNYCGVRDSWTAFMLRCCGASGDNVNFCPDPVTQIVTNGLCDMLPEIKKPNGKFILIGLYEKTATNEWIRELLAEIKDRGYTTVGFPQPEHPSKINADVTVDLPLSPLEWLAWLNASDGYIGVRFHPIVISQALGKPFVSLDHYDRGVPFSNRYFSKIGSLAAPFSRGISKTFDLAKRVGLEEFVIPQRRLHKVSAQQVMKLFEKATSEITPMEQRVERAEQFDFVLQSILK